MAYNSFILFFVLALTGRSLASIQAITLDYPLQQQLPPVARVKQAFSWTFSQATFESTYPLGYTVLNLPSWLSFTGLNQSFSGCPTTDDVARYSVQVTATTKDGQHSLTDTVELAVSDRSGNISLSEPIANQLVSNDSAITSAFPYPSSSPNYPGVRVPPNWSFSLGFYPSTFTAPSRVFYSASLHDGSPLPAWLTFNNQTVTFDGISPARGESVPSTYSILISGSDTFGFSDITQSFNIGIAAHELTQLGPVGVNFTSGSPLDETLDLAEVFLLDGKQMKKGDIANITLSTSGQEWITFDTSNNSLAGTPPSSLAGGQTATLPFTVTDKYGDAVNTTLTLAFFPSHFSTDSLPPIIATPGQTFNLSLGEYITSPETTNLSVVCNPSKASTWLTLFTANTSLGGTVPSDIDYDNVLVTLRAQDLITNAWSQSELHVSLASNGTTNTNHHRGLSTGTKIALASVGASVGGLILLCILLTACRRYMVREVKLANEAVDLEAPIEDDGKWGFEYKAETPAMDYEAKFGDPPSVQMLASRAEHEIITLPHLESGLSSRKGTLGQRFLRNPFAKQTRVIPKISNPIITPDFGNAAFQAQLAVAVESAGIVNRGTYVPDEDLPHDVTNSEFTDVDGDASAEMDVTDDSQFNGHSSRASWESEPPFVWATGDTPGRQQVGDEYPTSEDTHGTELETEENETEDEPVQRSDFRPTPRHDNVTPTPAEGSEEGISIDNIHFPTDSDIAHTEASSDHEAVIRTASRISARRTLDSPASDHTERGGGVVSPVITTHSRLVGFGKQKMVQVQVSDQVGDRRSISQTAVMGGFVDSPATSFRSDSEESTPRAMPSIPIPAYMIERRSSPSPPASLPSLPALPTLPSGVSSKPPSQSKSIPLQRILLGENEPFHFYPPLTLTSSPTSSSFTTSTASDGRPVGASGATYFAKIERDGEVLEDGEPGWLKFEDMELWGCPGNGDRGVWDVRVLERRGGVEKVVGRFALEVVGR